MRERGTSYIYCRGNHYPNYERAFPLSGDVNKRLPRNENSCECKVAGCANHTRLFYCLEHYPQIKKHDVWVGVKHELLKLIRINSESKARIESTKGSLLFFDFVALNHAVFCTMRPEYESWTRLWETIVSKYREYSSELGPEFAVRYAFIDNEDEESLPQVAPLVL